HDVVGSQLGAVYTEGYQPLAGWAGRLLGEPQTVDLGASGAQARQPLGRCGQVDAGAGRRVEDGGLAVLYGPADQRPGEARGVVARARHVVFGRAPLRVHAGSLTDVVRRAASSTGAGPAARPASARQGTNALVDTPMAPCYGWQESRFG